MRKEFQPELWMSESQIRSFFSKLTAQVKKT
jgi:hypothetical protein